MTIIKRRGTVDIVFHAASAVSLAAGFGEERPAWLLGAAAVGALPDATWPLVQLNRILRGFFEAG